jgi:hypothetical protein
VTLTLVIEFTLENDKLSLPEKLLESLLLATTETPFVGDVVVVVGEEVVVDEEVVVVVDGTVVEVVVDVVVGEAIEVVVDGVVDVVVPGAVPVVVVLGVEALPAPSHACGVPNSTGVAPTGAATRTLPELSMLIVK